MKRKSVSLIAGILLGSIIWACGQRVGSQTGSGGSGCSESALIGTWVTQGESISFSSSCVFTSTICGARATTSSATGTSGSYTLTNWILGDSSCSAQANRSCTYSLSGSTLQTSCTPVGGGTYTKQ